MINQDPIVQMRNVSKRFGKIQALDKINLDIKRGQIIGLLGANGAGKSTLLRHIIGLYLADHGQCITFGTDAVKLSSKELGRIGYVHQEGELLEWLTVQQLICYVSAYYKTWNHEIEEKYIKDFDISIKDRVASLSPGQRQEVAILLAIGFEPELLILDEPASALDPVARSQFLDLLLQIIQDEDRTVIISSHILSDVEKVIDNIKKFSINGLIAIGGDDTLTVAYKLHKMGIPVVGVPKTIDNDLSGTDYTFGFDTAVSIVTEAIDRLHTTAESHHRVIVVEVMGRHTGWIATIAGLAGGADEILIPEVPFDIEEVCKTIRNRYSRGKKFSIIAVAEGAYPKSDDLLEGNLSDKNSNSNINNNGLITKTDEKDAFGHVRLGGIGNYLAKEIEKRMDVETRVTALGHVQRGGSPTSHDRVLATRFGVAAVDLIKNQDFGRMVALQGNKIVSVELEDAISKLKAVDMELYEIAKIFFG